MIRYTFYFEEGNVSTVVHDELEDQRIEDFLDNYPKETLYCEGEDMDLYISLDKVKCITRQLVKEKPVQNQENETNG